MENLGRNDDRGSDKRDRGQPVLWRDPDQACAPESQGRREFFRRSCHSHDDAGSHDEDVHTDLREADRIEARQQRVREGMMKPDQGSRKAVQILDGEKA
ncbi:hypothetical protein [Tardiphaga sp. 619_E2_N8_5]|jgi:hypothetical protein|uniref:hypothetical protein n=1 Tax=unclassified Tardiphaga TaxID=2631404 RepID=UPI003F1F6038